MNKDLILKAVNLVFDFNENFYCAEKCFKFKASIDIGAKNLRLSLMGCNEFVYYEHSGDEFIYRSNEENDFEITNEENLNNFIELLAKLMEESK